MSSQWRGNTLDGNILLMTSTSQASNEENASAPPTKSLGFFFGLAWSGSRPFSLLEEGTFIVGMVLVTRILDGFCPREDVIFIFLLGPGASRIKSGWTTTSLCTSTSSFDCRREALNFGPLYFWEPLDTGGEFWN